MYIKDLFNRLTKKQGIPLLVYIVINILIITMFINLFAKILEIEKPTIVYLGIAIIIYAISTGISLSSIGEGIMRLSNGCKKIKRQDQIEKIYPIYNEVYARAKEINPKLDADIQLYMYYGEDMNAFAMGRKTICVSEGIMRAEPKYIKSVLAHEFGHISNKDTSVLLLIASGDVIISKILTMLSVIINGIAILARGSSDSQNDKDGWLFTIINAVLVGIIKIFSKVWAFWGVLLVRKSMREDEFKADQFAYTLGYGQALCEFLDKEAGHNPPGILEALKATHPDKNDRISNVQNLIKTYGDNSNGVNRIVKETVDNKHIEMLQDNTNREIDNIYIQHNELVNSESKNTLIICPNCGKELEECAQFCSKCGNRIEKQSFKECPKCGKRTLDDEAEFCIVCGTTLCLDYTVISKRDENKIATESINDFSNHTEIIEGEEKQDDSAFGSDNLKEKAEKKANRRVNFIIGIELIMIIGGILIIAILLWNRFNKSDVNELIGRNINFNESMSDILEMEEKNENTKLIEKNETRCEFEYNIQGEVLGLYDENATIQYHFADDRLMMVWIDVYASEQKYEDIVKKLEKRFGKGTLNQTMHYEDRYSVYETWKVDESIYLVGYSFGSISIEQVNYNGISDLSLFMVADLDEQPKVINPIDGAIISTVEGDSYYYKDNKYYKVHMLPYDIESIDYEDDNILIHFTEDGSSKFADFTSENLGEETYIVYKGDIIFSPTINEVITVGNCILELDNEKDKQIAKEISEIY